MPKKSMKAFERGKYLMDDAQIPRAIRDGVDRDGKPYKPPMAFGFYKNISDADMAALVAYLRTLKPQAWATK